MLGVWSWGPEYRRLQVARQEALVAQGGGRGDKRMEKSEWGD